MAVPFLGIGELAKELGVAAISIRKPAISKIVINFFTIFRFFIFSPFKAIFSAKLQGFNFYY